MEEHHYGGDNGGNDNGDLSAGSAAAARPNGWSSLTRLLRNPSPPPAGDPFPPLALALAPTTSSSAQVGVAAATANANNVRNNAENRQHRRATQIGNGTTNSGGGGVEPPQELELEVEQEEQQQRQRGGAGVVLCHSPASSAGSFSSNNSGRNNRLQSHHHHHRNHDNNQAEAQAALSSNVAAAAAAAANGLLIAAGGSPPESSSGSFAPNSFLVNNHHHHNKRDRHRGGHQRNRGGSAGLASSAGSFSLNPNPFRVQSGAYDARPVGGVFPQLGAQNGREREVSGGARIRNDEDRRDEISASAAAERDGLDVRPAVSDGRSSIGDVDREISNGAHGQQGKEAGDSTAASSAFHVPMEPEWEEEDLYLRVRSDALKEARARDKFARGASQAYVRGDHRMAKVLSKQAEEKRLLAEKLHAKAAAEILNQRNKQGSFDIWHLDLHGLHTSEAVAALESRLALLEHGLAEDHRLGVGSSNGPPEGGGHEQDVPLEQSQQQDPKQKLFQSLVPTAKLLSIVTGVGAHSQGGPTIPSAVKSFLISNGYQLEEPRAGVVSVRPKLRFSV
ncbi:unnamed protein product [Calypogeia fissa]